MPTDLREPEPMAEDRQDLAKLDAIKLLMCTLADLRIVQTDPHARH